MSTEESSTVRFSGFRLGCLTSVVVVSLLAVGGIGWWRHRAKVKEAEALAEAQENAEEAFDPVFEKLEEVTEETGPDYDIDKTIRVIHEIDLALENQDSLEDYLQFMATQDYRGVAPDVLDARRDIMEILLELYGKQTEAEDQQAMWAFTSELLLSTFSVVSVEGDVNPLVPAGSFSVDREQAQELLTDLKDRQAERRRLLRDINELEKQLFEELLAYSEVYYDYVEEWDQLSVLRDRAYLAARNQDWETVRDAAHLAATKAPQEKEAHLLEAMAMIELGNPEDDAQILDLLGGFVEDHPGSSAPAFLLLGVQHNKMGRHREARVSLQQSAAYYPKQAEQLTDMLNPYKMRSFLRKSREGTFIIEQYKSTMLGAGYFSPDLQMATVAFDEGEFDEGRRKLLDHFARRRAQAQWDFIISDIQFCHELLGPYFREIFPEDTYLDLEVAPTTFGSGLKLGVRNRSDRTLHNATLVLALHFTDMQPSDYEPIAAEATQPAVLAHETTSFGNLEIAVDMFGTTKGVDDIVHHRAILVANEAVVWVDTDEYRIAEAKEFREQQRMAGPSAPEPPPPSYRTSMDQIIDEVTGAASLEIESRYGTDNILFELPKELSILRPIFRLRYGDEIYTAADNFIEGDQINLRFKGIENFDDEEARPDDMELMLGSPFGDIVFTWAHDGELTYRYAGVDQE